VPTDRAWVWWQSVLRDRPRSALSRLLVQLATGASTRPISIVGRGLSEFAGFFRPRARIGGLPRDVLDARPARLQGVVKIQLQTDIGRGAVCWLFLKSKVPCRTQDNLGAVSGVTRCRGGWSNPRNGGNRGQPKPRSTGRAATTAIRIEKAARTRCCGREGLHRGGGPTQMPRLDICAAVAGYMKEKKTRTGVS